MKQLTITIISNRLEVSYSIMDNDGNAWSDTMRRNFDGSLRGTNIEHVEGLLWLSDTEVSAVEDILNRANGLVGVMSRTEDEEVE